MYPKTDQEYTEMFAYIAVFIVVVLIGLNFYKAPSPQLEVYEDQELVTKIIASSYRWDISDLSGDYYRFLWFYNPTDSVKSVQFQLDKETAYTNSSVILFFKVEPFDVITLNGRQVQRVSIFVQIKQPLKKTFLIITWTVK